MAIRVLIVDDHSVVVQGLKSLLSMDDELEIVGTASDGEEALKLAQQLQPQVVLLDLMLPGMDGIQVTLSLKKKWFHIKVLILTSLQDEKMVAKAVSAGASGYLLKNMEADLIQQAIKASLVDQSTFSPEVRGLLVAKPIISKMEMMGLATSNRPPYSSEVLTNREREILAQLVQGKSNKEIGYTLGVSEGTIKSHLSSIMAKWGVQSRTQLAVYASQSGIY